MKLNDHSVSFNVILWGGTGQAKLVRPVIELNGGKLVAIFDDTKGLRSPFKDVPLFCGDPGFEAWAKGKKLDGIGFCVTIGNPHGAARIKIAKKLMARKMVPLRIIHPSAVIADDVVIGNGCQIGAGAVIGPEVVIGDQCIINANASVDHECVLSDATEIGPGATLCGVVRTGRNAWVAAGATILPRLMIGSNVIVGAGAVVTKNIPDRETVVGIPARPMARKRK